MKAVQPDEASNLAIKWGVLSALAASLCCLGPLVLILLGVGGASTALSIGYRKPYFLAVGAVVLAVGFYLLYQKSCHQQSLTQRQRLTIFAGSFIIAILLYYLLTFIFTPWLAPLIYQWRFGG